MKLKQRRDKGTKRRERDGEMERERKPHRTDHRASASLTDALADDYTYRIFFDDLFLRCPRRTPELTRWRCGACSASGPSTAVTGSHSARY